MILLYTPGEPAGIGPDLILQAAQEGLHLPLLVVADPELLRQRANQLGIGIDIRQAQPDHIVTARPGELQVLPVKLPGPVTPGRLDRNHAAYVLETLATAARLCLDSPDTTALVTGPVHKGIINEAGIPFTGHTEFLADLGRSQPVMMLACPGLRVALVTTHLPLREVSDAISAERLEAVLRILHRDLEERFAIEQPRILVCGLNPHAGEGGHLGSEEMQLISPVLEKLRGEGMRLFGPLPADTIFTPPHLEKADAVLAMYHDQGLPVLKYRGFGSAVNITLGLPFVRTSVDHGTALDLAGTGKAQSGSLLAALETAAGMLKQTSG